MPAVLVAVVVAVLYVVLDPPSGDLAAQAYRADLFRHEGLALWDNNWYGGHHLLGYSLLFPPLGALVGLAAAGALSIIGGTAAFAALARRHTAAAMPAAVWFAFALGASVVSGRLPFALGVAVGLAALLAVSHERRAAAAVLGALTAAASPVAGLFACVLAAAVWWTGRRAAAAWLVVGAVVVGAALVLAFPEGGNMPFAPSAFWPALATAALAAALTRGTVRVAAMFYAIVLIAAFALHTPLGANASRLGVLAAGPLAIGLLWERRRRVLWLLAVPGVYAVVLPAARDWSHADGPARTAAYYAPLLKRLASEPVGRLEIPFTRAHWESAWVAPIVPLARGWERQLDLRVNSLFYDGTLTAASYGAWLRDNAISWIALPDAPLDPSARAEAQLLRGGLPFVREVWASEHWRLFAVRDPAPLGASAVGHDWFVTTGGVVRVHWTPYWAIVKGRGCVRSAPGDWTQVDPAPPGSEVRVGISWTVGRTLSHGPRCR